MKDYSWQAPSNIALVKYWGKYGYQLPMNPSLSFTLSHAVTKTKIKVVKKANKPVTSLKFNGKESGEKFVSRYEKYLNKNISDFKFLNDFSIEIETENTFPHSAGVASSASSFASFALCLIEAECEYRKDEFSLKKFQNTLSDFARRGSGSASRSLFGPVALWGECNEVHSSSNEYAVEVDGIHDVFKTFCDTILIVDDGEKKVSSSVGHELMNNHPFREIRKKHACENAAKLLDILKKGDLTSFIEIVESEALELHSMMMTSTPSFILMKPKTLEIIEKIREFREQTQTPVCFTLDAGPNVHVLYPKSEKDKVHEFLQQHQYLFLSKIDDEVGLGPKKL